jgi:hypothetical protein
VPPVRVSVGISATSRFHAVTCPYINNGDRYGVPCPLPVGVALACITMLLNILLLNISTNA